MSTKESLYKYRERIARYRRVIKKLRNGGLALKFLDHLDALGLSDARISKYASHIPPLLRVIDFDLKAANKQDVEKVVAWINSQPYAEWTKHDKKLLLRKLVQYAKYGSCDRNTPLPPEVSWIRLKVKKDKTRTTPESLLTKEDFEKLVKATANSRDKALLHVLFEAALRPGELLTMTVGAVEFKDRYCLISVNGKTGIKRLPLVASFKPLLDWLKIHPFRRDPNAPLWCSIYNSQYVHKPMSYDYFRQLIKRLARKTGLKKDVWPYLFRHSTLTNLAKVFTEARLEQFAGWVHGSEMSRRYVHFSARDLEDAVLELHGLKKPDASGGLLRLVECPRCGSQNPPGTVYCSLCGFVLDKEMVIELNEREREKDEVIIRRLEELAKRLEALEETFHHVFGVKAESYRKPDSSSP